MVFIASGRSTSKYREILVSTSTMDMKYKPRRAHGTPRQTLQHSPFFLSFLTPRTVKKKIALFSHKKQGNKFPKDRVMITAKTKPEFVRRA